MSTSPSDCDAAIDRAARNLAAEAGRAVREHPAVEILLGYLEGQLAERDQKLVRRHLVDCPQCAREVLGLKTFDLEVPEESNLLPSNEESLADFAEFQRRIGRGEKPTPETPDGGRLNTGQPSKGWPPRREWWVLAASMLLAFSGLGFWIFSLLELGRGSSDRATRSTANPYVFDLVPDVADQTREAPRVEGISIPPGMDPLVPRLNLGDQTPYTLYRVEILDSHGKLVWEQAELKRLPAGNFAVLVARSILPSGTYRLRLFGEESGREQILAVYSFWLL